MNLSMTQEPLPSAEDNLAQNKEEHLLHDDYAIINIISFEKSFTRLKSNYLIPSTVNSLDAYDHHQ